MPIIEVNPALILRNADEAQRGTRKREECLPEVLEVGKIYPFLKKDQRIYWLDGELPLIEKSPDGELSRPVASVQVIEVTHVAEDGRIFTRGLYKVVEVFDDAEIHFDGMSKVNV